MAAIVPADLFSINGEEFLECLTCNPKKDKTAANVKEADI